MSRARLLLVPPLLAYALAVVVVHTQEAVWLGVATPDVVIDDAGAALAGRVAAVLGAVALVGFQAMVLLPVFRRVPRAMDDWRSGSALAIMLAAAASGVLASMVFNRQVDTWCAALAAAGLLAGVPILVQGMTTVGLLHLRRAAT